MAAVGNCSIICTAPVLGKLSEKPSLWEGRFWSGLFLQEGGTVSIGAV